MVQPHHTIDPVTPTVTGGLRPYEFIATPPIALVLDAIVVHCGLGGSITPGVREIGRWAGVSAGQISPILYQLADDGWILYDGRVITLVRHPDQPDDQLGTDESDLCADQEDDLTQDRHNLATDRTDQAKDRPDLTKDRFGAEREVYGAVMRKNAPSRGDLAKDRFRGRMVHDHEQQQDLSLRSAVANRDQVPCATDFDQAADRLSPAAQVMAELGAEPAVIADALLCRPDWTPQQVRDRWAYDQERIAQSDGKLTEGVFFHALRRGQLAPPRANPERPIEVAAYAGNDQFRAGDDVSDLEAAEESPHERAGRIAPDDATGLEFVFLVGRIGGGATDEEALAALQERRASTRSAAPTRADRAGGRFGAGGHGR